MKVWRLTCGLGLMILGGVQQSCCRLFLYSKQKNDMASHLKESFDQTSVSARVQPQVLRPWTQIQEVHSSMHGCRYGSSRDRPGMHDPPPGLGMAGKARSIWKEIEKVQELDLRARDLVQVSPWSRPRGGKHRLRYISLRRQGGAIDAASSPNGTYSSPAHPPSSPSRPSTSAGQPSTWNHRMPYAALGPTAHLTRFRRRSASTCPGLSCCNITLFVLGWISVSRPR